MHAQIVLCPGLNDGAHLERTVQELAPLHPQIATTAIVPVGLTRHRERLPQLRTLRDDEARALVATAHAWQARFLSTLGSRFVFLGDEVYLQAEHALPVAEDYEGFVVAEDGIGLVRRFEDDLARAASRARASAPGRRVTVVSGTLYGPRLAARLAALAPAARVVSVPNEFFGGTVAVAGLLTGQDIQRHLAAAGDLGEAVLVPAVALRDGEGVFLDDLTPADLSRSLGVPVVPVETSARALARALHAA
jgi:putative radical SAM enzyme (TIGR03279 family)